MTKEQKNLERGGVLAALDAQVAYLECRAKRQINAEIKRLIGERVRKKKEKRRG